MGINLGRERTHHTTKPVVIVTITGLIIATVR